MMAKQKIDFVVTWLDANDPKWIEQYSKYRTGVHKEDNGRYRNWDFFKYWFRAVEKYAPWVNRVFLVTNGRNPDWINPNNPKLVLVKHSDYIPEKYLPTFNSCAIELNFHRIDGLSEHFVYFNDDMFLNSRLEPDFFFKEGLPCDCNLESVFTACKYTEEEKFGIFIQRYVDVALLNGFFSRKEVVRNSWRNWYGLHLGIRNILINYFLLNRKDTFEGFQQRHLGQPFLKSLMNEVWDIYEDVLDNSCTKFRNPAGVNPYLFRYWQFASNKFYPVKDDFGQFCLLKRENVNTITNSLNNERIKTICLNDYPNCNEDDYYFLKATILNVFEDKFPIKSSFEL